MENSSIERVRNEDREEYQKFLHHLLGKVGSPHPPILWHYTSGNGLLDILRTGSLYATHIACLNDSLEYRYLGDLVHDEIKLRMPNTIGTPLEPLYTTADDLLKKRDTSAVGQFVTCFSEIGDDLGQWRGYGGGECGYAIGFETAALAPLLSKRPNTVLAPLTYDATRHADLVGEIVHMAEVYYHHGLSRGLANDRQWAEEFLAIYTATLDLVVSVVKHPKFEREAERRIITQLLVGEHRNLEFRQKRTLLARHLPIDLRNDATPNKTMPIAQIMIGPGPAQQVTKISVGDVLLKFGYEGVKVECSLVPYRTP